MALMENENGFALKCTTYGGVSGLSIGIRHAPNKLLLARRPVLVVALSEMSYKLIACSILLGKRSADEQRMYKRAMHLQLH